MSNEISARGYVTVVLVMNMRRFIEPADRKRFETLRGTKTFLDVLRTRWPGRIEQHGTFRPCRHPLDGGSVAARMPTDEAAFLSGIFRSTILEDFAVPQYFLENKAGVDFPPGIQENVQFKNVFMEVWSNWEIYVRPTVTGMFVITLRRKYERTTPLLKIASDVITLQSAFDIPGANRRLDELTANLENGTFSVQEKKRSIEAFLSWLDADQKSADWHPHYAPVQWKLAMEVCRRLVLDAGREIDIADAPVHMRPPDRTSNTPLHDSFLIYHLDDLLVAEPIVQKSRAADADGQAGELALSVGQPYATEKGAMQRGAPKIPVKPNEILGSDEIRKQIVALLEGAVLRRTELAQPKNGARAASPKSAAHSRSYFPEHRMVHVQDVLAFNTATWNDELCVLTARAALIMPGRYSREDELLLSNFSASTGKVLYQWYWEAMERMFEFVIEVRVLTQLIERGSTDLLEEFESELTRVRHGMSQRNIRVNYAVLADKVERIANMSRLLGLSRSLTTPSVWGRAEFAVAKARLLLAHQDVPALMQHAERNISNLNELINHIDELYLADLSESNNRMSFYLSTLLAGLSLSVVVFAVISFWADADEVVEGSVGGLLKGLVPNILLFGNGLAVLLSLVALLVLAIGISAFVRDLGRSVRYRRQRRRAGG